MFTHHKLKVYDKALVFAASPEELSASWGRHQAMVDHFRRAAESLLLNIAQGARLWSGSAKVATLDYSIGSALECAACLDIARINVAEGNGRYSELDHRRFLEVAEASAVRAAVYLDLCGLKALPAQMETSHGGKLLIRISAMLNKL